MRCKACDVELKDHEVRRKGLFTGDYIDLCDVCFDTVAEDVPLSSGDVNIDEVLKDDNGQYDSHD